MSICSWSPSFTPKTNACSAIFVYSSLCINLIAFHSFIFNQELDYVVEELEKIAVVNLLQNRSIISLIGNVQRSSLILEKVQYYVLSSWILFQELLLKVLFRCFEINFHFLYHYLGPSVPSFCSLFWGYVFVEHVSSSSLGSYGHCQNQHLRINSMACPMCFSGISWSTSICVIIFFSYQLMYCFFFVLTLKFSDWPFIAGLSCSSNPWGQCSNDLSGCI